MNKQIFLQDLQNELGSLPEKEIEKTINFYSEIIDDQIEDGFTEEQAIDKLGNVEKIAEEIYQDYPTLKLINQKIDKRTNRFSHVTKIILIILLIIFSPLILPVVISLASIVFAFYVTLLAILFAVVVTILAFGLYAIIGPITGIILFFTGNFAQGIFNIGTGFASAAIFLISAIILFYIIKGIFKIHKYLFIKLRKSLIKGGKDEKNTSK